MGNESQMNSAICLCGDNITPETMINMTHVKGGTERTTFKLQRRNKWMEHLINDTHGNLLTQKKKEC